MKIICLMISFYSWSIIPGFLMWYIYNDKSLNQINFNYIIIGFITGVLFLLGSVSGYWLMHRLN
jgi:RsiW-degrading membrane proteinase PrsW (M82 family)